MENNVTILTKDDTQHRTRATEMIAKADALVITADREESDAAELGKQLKTYLNDVEGYFAPEIEDAHALHKKLCAKRNAVVDPLKAALQRLGAKLGVYQDKKRRDAEAAAEKARVEAEEKEKKEKAKLLEKAAAADAAGNTEKADDLMNQAENVYVAPKPVAPVMRPQGTALRFNVEVIIKDASKVPNEFKIVDEAKLKRYFKDADYKLVVPGVVFTKKPIAGFR